MRRTALLAFGVGSMLVILCLLIALTYANFRGLAQAHSLNIYTYQVLEKVVTLRAALDEEESRLRGFALTGDIEFLDAAQSVELEAGDALQRLNVLTQDAAQKQRLKRLEDAYLRWSANYATVKNPTLKESRRIADQTPERRADLKQIKSILSNIESTERNLLIERAHQQSISQYQTAKFLLFASVCAISFTSFFIVMLGMQVRALSQSNRQLLDSQAQLGAVLDNAPLVLYAVDPDEKFTLMTGKSAATIGMSHESTVGKNLIEVLGADYEGLEAVRAALRGETNISKSEMRSTIFETNRLPLRDASGNITGMIGVAVDVTQRWLAESALRDSETRFRSVIESVQEIVFQTNDEGNWTFLNPAWRIALGHDLDSSVGRTIFEFVHPGDHAEIVSYFEAFLEGHTQLQRGLVRFSTRSGYWRWMDIQVQAQRDPEGNLLGMAGTLSDITDRKLAQEELLATTTLQKAILNSANYSIIAVNADGIIESFNRAAQELLGYTAAEVRGEKSMLIFHDEMEIEDHARELSFELGEAVPPDFQVFALQARDGAIGEGEWTYLCRDGKRVPMHLSISELRDAEGEISGFVFIGYDLTESRRAERIKNEFVSVVSHELRTPLTSIRGALGLLAGGVAGQLPDSARQMIEIAQKNSERLVLLINDILDIEKIESGKMRFETRPILVRDLLQNAVEQNLAYGEPLGVNIVLEGAASLDSLEILGDESRLQQVLSNLLSNACKFTPSAGTVHVSAKTQGEQVEISVRDEGPGVPPEFVPRLFDKFAQADSTATRKQGGTGLGLAIARAIVEKHGGTIDYVAPREGEVGACFVLRLALIKTTLSARPPSASNRFLICEDDVEIAALLRVMVMQNGYEGHIVGSLKEARAALKQGNFAGMTLDLMLPDGDGLELLAELRAAPETRDLPVIVVSMRARQGKIEGEAFGVLDWLHKPIDAVRLLGTLDQLRPHGSAQVLHVEDDADVRQIMAAILGDNASITAAATLGEARWHLLHSADSVERFDIAILDIGLPDGSGLDLVPLLSAFEPPIPVVLFSASEVTAEEASTVRASLVKSRTTNEDLRATIQRLLSGE